MMSGPAPKKQRINPLCLGGVGRPCSCDSPFWVEKHDCLKGCVCGKGRGGCQGVVCGGVGGREGGGCTLWYTLETNLRNKGWISVDRSTKTTLARTKPCSSCKSYTKDLTQPTCKISIQQHAFWGQRRNYKIRILEGISIHMILAEVDIIASAWILT